jgi:hypothetical protein
MNGPTLAALQEKLQEHILRGSDAVREHVADTGRVSASTRLAIYSNAYVSRLTEALAHNFPALAKLLGPHDFAGLARDYVATHDSRHFSIRWYGGSLVEYLATDARYARAPLLAELARWEWAIAAAFDAADAPGIDADALADIAPGGWARLRFTWHPSAQVLAHTWNAPQIWKALTQDEERPAAELSAEPRRWLVWRHELDVRFRSLESAEAAAIEVSRAGGTFGEVCEALAIRLGEASAAPSAAAYLRGWLDARCLIAATLA